MSISPQLKPDDHGNPTEEAVIVIGVRKLNPLRLGPGTAALRRAVAIPTKLPVISPEGAVGPSQFVEVIIEEEGEVVHGQASAVPGGVVSVDGGWGYILSNNHVIAAENAGALVWDRDADTVLGPDFAGGGVASYGNKIGRVLALLAEAYTVYDPKGRAASFPTVDVRFA